MMRWFSIFGLCLLLAASGCAAHRHSPVGQTEGVRQLPKADVLPLALDDRFEFRKNLLFRHDPDVTQTSGDKMLTFERERYDYGAVTREEREQRHGHYFTFSWRNTRPANVKVRLEYRQGNLTNYVLAKEIDLGPTRPGTHTTRFAVIGDDYKQDGPVIAWRAVLIENNRIVALTQSALWH